MYYSATWSNGLIGLVRKGEGDIWYHRDGGSYMYQPSDFEILVEWDSDNYNEVYVSHLKSFPPESEPLDITFSDGVSSKNGWLSPDEKFYPCGYMGHIDLAEHLGAVYYDEIVYPDELIDKGWVKIDTTVISYNRNAISDSLYNAISGLDATHRSGESTESDEYNQQSFFKPDKSMIDWIVDYANGRKIVDYGCGNGSLVYALNTSGADAMGIDLCSFNDIIPKYCYKLDLTKTTLTQDLNSDDHLVLMCRPCHGTWIDLAIDNTSDGVEVLYIGKPTNVFDDLYNFDFEHVPHSGSSDDYERVYKVIR